LEIYSGVTDHEVYADELDGSGGHDHDATVESVLISVRARVVCVVHDDVEGLNAGLGLNDAEARRRVTDELIPDARGVLLERQLESDVDDDPLDLEQQTTHVDSVKSALRGLERLLPEDDEPLLGEGRDRVDAHVVEGVAVTGDQDIKFAIYDLEVGGVELWSETITVTLDAATTDSPVSLLGRLPLLERDDVILECAALTASLREGYDFTREIRITDVLAIGETVLVRRGGHVSAFAVCHSAPLVEGRARDEVRVLKFVAATDSDAALLVTHLTEYARRCGTRRVAIRVQGDATRLYAMLVARGGRVRWTDLRMTLAGYAESSQPDDGVMLSNWEI
jgi:hypothetical protein